MDYTELRIDHPGDEDNCALLISELSACGFESFAEVTDSLIAYIPASMLDDKLRTELDKILISEKELKYTIEQIPDQNWNALWESNFRPVMISGKCFIRAPFHPANNEVLYEIVIEPKMAFGTAHHETTALMIESMLEMDFRGKTVLDMGCGTGILAILANKSGASVVTAIDNDEWAYRNACENFRINGLDESRVIMGDARQIADQKFDIILANINRNILIHDMKAYGNALSENGHLLLSGFYKEDSGQILEVALLQGMKMTDQRSQNNWMCLLFEMD